MPASDGFLSLNSLCISVATTRSMRSAVSGAIVVCEQNIPTPTLSTQIRPSAFNMISVTASSLRYAAIGATAVRSEAWRRDWVSLGSGVGGVAVMVIRPLQHS